MRQTTFLIICSLGFSVFAQPPAPNLENVTGQEIVAPVLINILNNKNEAYAGVFTAEATEQRPDALTILRQELNRQAQLEQAKAQKEGVFISTNKRFAPESLTFFIAIGAVTFNSMWIKSHGDPLAMERHILSLKDPIAHLSFYAFMQANGFYMSWGTKRLSPALDAATRKQMMTMLSYKGMAIGSFASSIVADLGQSVKMCVDSWLLGKTDEASLQSCNQAWTQWTVRGKFTQYFPQIVALWAAQAASTFVEHLPKRGAELFTRVAPESSNKIKNFAKKILNKDSLVKMAYKITAADVTLTFASGGWVIKSIKFAGKLTKFTLFVSVDHALSNYIYRPLNNLIRPLFFDFDAIAINKLWREADQGHWEQAKIKDPVEKFEKEIENYGAQMQQWREHLNADAEADLAGWMEMTKEILNQIDYAYKYYLGFTGFLFESLNVNHQIHAKELAVSAAENISQYPFRALPFYGVTPGLYKTESGKIEDLYLLNPNELEKRQKEHVLNTAEKYKSAAILLKSLEQKEYYLILEKLLSQDNIKMASGLNDLNKVNAPEKMYVAATGTYEDIAGYSTEFQDLAHKLKKELGHPQPVVYPLAGYSQAFAAYSVHQVTAEAADYSKWSASNKYNFNKEADLMLYKIICGAALGSIEKTKVLGTKQDALAPMFNPPSLLKSNPDRHEFCNSFKSTNNLYSAKIAEKDLKKYILENINAETIGDYRNKNKAANFENWWLKNARVPINAEFKNFDLQYKKLVELAHNNYFDQRSFFKFFADGITNQSKYLPKSLNASLKAEANVYLQMLARTLTEDSALPLLAQNPYNRPDYLEFAHKNSEQKEHTTLYKKTPAEVEKLNNLLNAYSAIILQNNIDFDSYIAHSKKIDTAINNILVLSRLKKVIKVFDLKIPEDLSAQVAASVTGTENTDNTYEDISVPNPTYKQRMTIAAVRGLRQVESEIRRFIRMKVTLSQSLELDTQEFAKDWDNANRTQLNSSKAKKIGPLQP